MGRNVFGCGCVRRGLTRNCWVLCKLHNDELLDRLFGMGVFVNDK